MSVCIGNSQSSGQWQWHSGILRDKKMDDKFMYILNDDTQNCPFCILHLAVETFGHSTYQNSMKDPKVV